MKKIVVLTGAGMSVESGLKTFRDADGLWEEYPVQQVATHEGWLNDPTLVTNFYNMLRKKCWGVKPNEGHRLVAELEKKSLMTGFCVKADSVMGVINSLPAGVITTCTSAPALMSPRIIRQALYAAIEPVIPKTIFFPLSMVILLKRNGAEPRLTNYFCASRRRMRVSTCLVLYVKSPARIQL